MKQVYLLSFIAAALPALSGLTDTEAYFTFYSRPDGKGNVVGPRDVVAIYYPSPDDTSNTKPTCISKGDDGLESVHIDSFWDSGEDSQYCIQTFSTTDCSDYPTMGQNWDTTKDGFWGGKDRPLHGSPNSARVIKGFCTYGPFMPEPPPDQVWEY